MELVLYQFESCPYCQKVLKVIKDLDLKLTIKDTKKNKEDKEELIKLNGKTQVPCLVIDGKPMLESDDIIKFLKENYAKK